jgi:hypothetical protein
VERPKNELKSSSIDRTPVSARRLLAYLLRALLFRVNEASVGASRYASLPSELSSCLIPTIVSERTMLGFWRVLCSRFSVDVHGKFPLEAWLPEGRIRWDIALSAIDHEHAQMVVRENPDVFAAFASRRPKTVEDALEDDAVLNSMPAPSQDSRVVSLPARFDATPRDFTATWTLLSPLAHGADQKSGNVTLFRRQPVFDCTTGRLEHVPFLSGNAIRGQWRDLVMGRWVDLLGVNWSAVPTPRAHALLAGGSVEAGADSSMVNTEQRRLARTSCPPLDLFGGVVEQQIMQGRLRVHDASLVCREQAWLVHHYLSPDQELGEFASGLMTSSECTRMRQKTRMAHREIDNSDGIQMLVNVEHLVSGCRMIHGFQLWGLDGVSEVTASCMADLLDTFQSVSTIGAMSSAGCGRISIDGYRGPGLPSGQIYVAYVEQHREMMIEWLLSETNHRRKR